MRQSRHRTIQGQTRSGFSLFEVTVSAMLVGFIFVAAGKSVSTSIMSQRKVADRAKAAWLADALIAEIQPQSYMEPGASSSTITRETGETNTSRSNYDDVDDYHNWSDSPPQNEDGTTIPNLTGWYRTCTVQWVTLNNIATTSASETGVKKVIVTVGLNGTAILNRVIIRTKGS